MNDKSLADAVEVILGFNPVDMFGDNWDEEWRVAGALMEMARDVGFCPLKSELFFDPENESLPRAIIEATVEALTNE